MNFPNGIRFGIFPLYATKESLTWGIPEPWVSLKINFVSKNEADANPSESKMVLKSNACVVRISFDMIWTV